jgi:hypothetical protein
MCQGLQNELTIVCAFLRLFVFIFEVILENKTLHYSIVIAIIVYVKYIIRRIGYKKVTIFPRNAFKFKLFKVYNIIYSLNNDVCFNKCSHHRRPRSFYHESTTQILHYSPVK